MTTNYQQILRGMRSTMAKTRDEFESELHDCPRGSLWRTDCNGKVSYFWAYREGDTYVRREISRDPGMQQRLARKAYLAKSLKLLDQNIHHLDRALRGLQPLECGAVVSRLARAYQELPGEYFLYPSDGI